MTKPVPAPDQWTSPYWEAAKQHRLVMQTCRDCRFMQYPPEVVCRRCQSDRFDFQEVGARARLYSFATIARPFMPEFELPYVVGLIELDDHPQVRMMTNIVGASPEELQIGMPLEVVFESRGEWALPQFRPARSADST